MPGFVIQGGDGQFGREPNLSDSVGQGGPGYEFADDPVTVPYKRGTVAMANSGPNTNGSQFFIVLADVRRLDPTLFDLRRGDVRAWMSWMPSPRGRTAVVSRVAPSIRCR